MRLIKLYCTVGASCFSYPTPCSMCQLGVVSTTGDFREWWEMRNLGEIFPLTRVRATLSSRNYSLINIPIAQSRELWSSS